MFDNKKRLIVVYDKKDEIALNYLKQLVLTYDDNSETGEIVGTKDGSIEVIAWTEKVYLDNIKNRNIGNKVIFMDDIKGVEKITPIMKVKYDKYGVKYGVSGNNAVISIDEKVLDSDFEYEAFQKLYKEELLKVDMNVSDEKLEESKKTRKAAQRTRALAVVSSILAPGVGVAEVASAIATGKKSIKLTREMMFLYAITKFYLEEMEEFINH